MTTKIGRTVLAKKPPSVRRVARKPKGQTNRNGQPVAVVVPVTTLAPEPFELLRDVPVVVTPHEGEYIATFFDAGLNACGETALEAVANLKDLMIGWFAYLGQRPSTKLGPEPARLLAVLKTVMRACA